jgi:putative endonuclease
MPETKTLGKTGEKIGEKYLKEKGYKILDKNFRYSKLGELDIIAKKDNNVIFFEVKARFKKGLSEFRPEDNITFQKQKKLVKLARIYLAKNLPAGRQENKDTSWQIDILAIEIYRNGTYDIRHLENAVGDFY